MQAVLLMQLAFSTPSCIVGHSGVTVVIVLACLCPVIEVAVVLARRGWCFKGIQSLIMEHTRSCPSLLHDHVGCSSLAMWQAAKDGLFLAEAGCPIQAEQATASLTATAALIYSSWPSCVLACAGGI